MDDVVVLSIVQDDTLTETLMLDFVRVTMKYTDPLTGTQALASWDEGQQRSF